MTFGTIDQTNSTYWVSRRVKRATSMKMKNPAGLFHIWTQQDHHTAGLSFPAARYQTHLLHYRHTPHLYFCVHNLKGKWTQYNNVSMLITRSMIFFALVSYKQKTYQMHPCQVRSYARSIILLVCYQCGHSGVLDLYYCVGHNVCRLVLSMWTRCVRIVLLCTNWYYLGGRGGISRPESPYRC